MVWDAQTPNDWAADKSDLLIVQAVSIRHSGLRVQVYKECSRQQWHVVSTVLYEEADATTSSLKWVVVIVPVGIAKIVLQKGQRVAELELQQCCICSSWVVL